MNFQDKLRAAMASVQSCACVGLDPRLHRLPVSITQSYSEPTEQVFQFLHRVIECTAPHCAAYKPNLGFFEALGPQGLAIFKRVIDAIPDGKIIIADAKRGDISATAEHYARAYFEIFGVDAITLNPLMGFESLHPFLDYPEKGVYSLALTSNPGADDFLKKPFSGHQTMAAYIAETLANYDEKSATHAGMVVGATQPAEIADVIHHHPNGALLIPGIGAQGGSIDALSRALSNHPGLPLVNSSRGILYAGEGTQKWEQAIGKAAQDLKQTLQPMTNRYV